MFLFFPLFCPLFIGKLLSSKLLESFTRLISDILHSRLCAIVHASDLRSELFSLIKCIQFFSMNRFSNESSNNANFLIKIIKKDLIYATLERLSFFLSLSLSLRKKLWNARQCKKWKFSQWIEKKKIAVKFVSGNLTIFRNSSERKNWNDFFPYFSTFSIHKLLQPRVHIYIYIYIV